jgi:hypothetical protein
MTQAVSRRPLTTPGSVHVARVALGQVFRLDLRFYSVNIIPPWLSYSRTIWRMKKIGLVAAVQRRSLMPLT